MKARFIAGAALICLGGAAFAQQQARSASIPPTPTAEPGQSAPLQDIVVTAQRRSERLQDVPISITAADATTLSQARVENISNIATISPSVNFQVSNISSASANIVIRGLGTTGNSRSFEGAVGVFIDGVYRTRAAAALQNFLDIQSLQVLRGPQGTLFGKNTSAGAVLLASTKPDVSKAEGNFQGTYGNYDTYSFKGAVNVPISTDVAALRIAGMYDQGSGYITDTNGRDLNRIHSQGYKAQLLIAPTDTYSLQLVADYSKSNGNCCYGTVNYLNGPTQPLINALTQSAGRQVPSNNLSKRQSGLDSPSGQRIEDYGLTALFSAELGDGTLKSVTAMRNFDLAQTNSDADFSPAAIFVLNESFNSQFLSQEFTYSGKIPSIRANYVVGGFFSDEKLKMARDRIWGNQAQTFFDALLSRLPPGTAAAPAGTTSSEQMRGSARSYAGFAHFDAEVFDKVNLILGARYSIEQKSGQFAYTYFTPLRNAAFVVLGVSPGPNYQAKTTNHAVSGTAGIQYRPSSDAMVYLTYNRGFKAGGVNIDANGAGTLRNNPALTPGATPLSPKFAPETVDAIELGTKLQYFDRRARTNIAFFYNDISNLQVAQFIGLQFTVLNAKSAKTYGAEIENLFELAPGVTLSLDGTYVPHAKYGVDPSIGILSGQRFRLASKFAGNASVNFDLPLSSDLNLIGRAQYQYSSPRYINTASSSRIESVGLLNGNIGLKSTHLGIQVEGWILNALNKTYVSQAFNTPLQTGDENAYLAPPRTYGITVRGKF
jgi:outer membrane receptor protein involved in Fe transport